MTRATAFRLLLLARSLDGQHLKPIARAAARQRKAPLRKAPPAPRGGGQNITRYLLVSQPRSADQALRGLGDRIHGLDGGDLAGRT